MLRPRTARHAASAVCRCAQLLLTTLLACSAASASDTPKPGNPSFGPVGDLAGRCFTGTLPNGHVDVHCFRAIYGGAFIRDRHVVTGGAGPYCGQTLYAPVRDEEPIRFWYWANSGDVREGTVLIRPGALVFPETVRSETGTVDYRTTWQLAPDGYRSVLEQRRDGEWVLLWDVEFAAVEDPGRYAALCEDPG